MNKSKYTVTLNTPSNQRLVKRLALLTFSGVRGVLDNASKVPSIMTQASHDVCEAWQETSHPKA